MVFMLYSYYTHTIDVLYNTIHIYIHLHLHIFTYSLAGLIRLEFDGSNKKDMAIRTALLFRLSAKMKWLADTYKIAIVVINQV